jgi:hypothetical protein
MTPITNTARFQTGLGSDDVRERTIAWFAHLTHRVDVDEPGRLVVSSGSQAKMRLLGGAFIARSSLPTRTEIAWVGGDVTVTAQDAVGFGVKTGMKGKYEEWCAEIVAGVRAALA